MTGQRSTGTRRAWELPAWWGPLIEVLAVATMLAVLAVTGLVAYNQTRPAAKQAPTPINITVTVASPAPSTPTPTPAPTKKATK